MATVCPGLPLLDGFEDRARIHVLLGILDFGFQLRLDTQLSSYGVEQGNHLGDFVFGQ